MHWFKSLNAPVAILFLRDDFQLKAAAIWDLTKDTCKFSLDTVSSVVFHSIDCSFLLSSGSYVCYISLICFSLKIRGVQSGQSECIWWGSGERLSRRWTSEGHAVIGIPRAQTTLIAYLAEPSVWSNVWSLGHVWDNRPRACISGAHVYPEVPLMGWSFTTRETRHPTRPANETRKSLF